MSKNQKDKKEIKRDDNGIVGDQERKIQEKDTKIASVKIICNMFSPPNASLPAHL